MSKNIIVTVVVLFALVISSGCANRAHFTSTPETYVVSGTSSHPEAMTGVAARARLDQYSAERYWNAVDKGKVNPNVHYGHYPQMYPQQPYGYGAYGNVGGADIMYWYGGGVMPPAPTVMPVPQQMYVQPGMPAGQAGVVDSDARQMAQDALEAATQHAATGK